MGLISNMEINYLEEIVNAVIVNPLVNLHNGGFTL